MVARAVCVDAGTQTDIPVEVIYSGEASYDGLAEPADMYDANGDEPFDEIHDEDDVVLDDVGGQVPSDVNVDEIEEVVGGQVPSDVMSILVEIGGHVPSDLGNLIFKVSSSLVCIEDLDTVEVLAARSLGRLGVSTRPPMAFVGMARRCYFNEDVATMSYTNTDLGDDLEVPL